MIWKDKTNKKFLILPQESQKKIFWIKLFQNELPTMDKLAIRRPDIYGNLKQCPMCYNEEETIDHLFVCLNTKDEIEDMWKEAREEITKSKTNEENGKKEKEIFEALEKIRTRTINSSQEYIKMLMGLFLKDDIKSLQKSTGWSRKRCGSVITNICDILRENFRQKVWKKRCKEQLTREATLGITAKNKKTKTDGNKGQRQSRKEKQRKRKRKSPKKEEKKKEAYTTHEIKSKDQEERREKSNLDFYNSIKGWIQKGMKWMGM